MLKCCENCIDRSTVSYEDLIQICGRCREVKKADMVDYANKKDPFNGKRWRGGKCSLITEEQRKGIRELYKSGTTQTEISKLYGISQPTISNILNR